MAFCIPLICFCFIPCDTTYLKVSAPWSQKHFSTKRSVSSLGYVGLPLAEAFSRHLKTNGYLRNQKAVDELNTTPGNKIEATTDPAKIRQADFVIIGCPHTGHQGKIL